MKVIRSKWLAMMLAVVMLVGSLGMGFTLASNSYYELFNVLSANYLSRVVPADILQMSLIVDVLKTKQTTLKNEIKNNLNEDAQYYLTQYGFTDEKIDEIYDWILAQESDIRTVLVATALENEQDIAPDYSDYETLLVNMSDELWGLMPEAFVNRSNAYAALYGYENTPENRIDFITALISEFLANNSSIGVATGINATDYSLNLVVNTDITKTNTIVNNIESQFNIEISERLVNAAVSTTNQIMNLVESDFGNNQNIIDLLIKFELLVVNSYTAPVDPGDTGGSSGGGGGGGGAAPAPGPAPVDQPIPEPEKPVGTPNPDSTYTSLAMREALQLMNTAVLTQAKVDPVLEDLEKEVLAGNQDIVETLQIVERAEALVAKLLENDALTDNGAINYTNQILTQFIAPALEKDAVGGTHHELEALAASMIESVLERIGSMDAAEVITDAMVKAAVAEQNNALVMMEEGLSAIFTDAEIAALSQNVSVVLDETSVKLDPAAVAYMKSNDIGINVVSGSVSMTLPAAMMDSVRTGLSLVVELESKSGSGLGNKMTNGAQGTVGAAYDLSVYLVNNQDAVVEVLSNIDPVVSLPLGNFRTNLHTVGAYYYNEASGVWEYVRSRVVGDRVVFRAPHLSTYGILQRNVVFTDMTNHWAKAVIEELAVKGIVSGRSLTEYEPNGTITRAEFATLLVQALELQGDVKVTFNDVYNSDWYYEYVNVAALHGLVSGVGSGKFDPNANITRQDMAIMIMKAYEKLVGTSVKSVPVGIKDLAQVSAYAKDRVLAARFNKLIGGYPDGTFMPVANATRAEAGQMVKNLLAK